MDNILIKNGYVILFKMDDNKKIDTVIKKLDVYIKKDTIYKIGKNIDCNPKDTKIVDAEGKVVMPGLINMHVHTPMSIFRETIEGCSLSQWLNEKIWPMEAKMTEDDTYYASMLSILEAIRSGTVFLNDHYFLVSGMLQATKKIPIRYSVSNVLRDSDNNGDKRIEEYMQIYNDRDETVKTNVYNIMALHGLYSSKESYIEKVASIAHDKGLTVHMHFCEDDAEVNTIKEIYKVQNPSDVLLKHFKELNLILAHCTKVTEKDLEVIRKLNASVVHNPVSNLRLGCGFAPIQKMMDMGINVCLGTDGQGSGSSLDMFEAMRVAALLQKGSLENHEVMKATDVIQMATINGAKALNMDDSLGSIEEGKKADLIIIDMDYIGLQPVNNLISNIVYNVTGRDVSYTIVNGEILMDNKKIIVDQKDIVLNCEKIIKRISK